MNKPSFQAKVAPRGYHVYKDTIWGHAKVGDRIDVQIEDDPNSKLADPYACAVKSRHPFFNMLVTVGHIPREISRHVYYFIKEEGGHVDGTVLSLQYRPSPIPTGGLEIPLMLQFSCSRLSTLYKMRTFVRTLYKYDFEGEGAEEVKRKKL